MSPLCLSLLSVLNCLFFAQFKSGGNNRTARVNFQVADKVAVALPRCKKTTKLNKLAIVLDNTIANRFSMQPVRMDQSDVVLEMK